MRPAFPPHGGDHPLKSDIRHRRHGSAGHRFPSTSRHPQRWLV
jgi:hypothetical protein